MHIIFISECHKKAVKKTRTVLDRFALRIGRRTWATPATEEGLSEIWLALRRVATRQTAVACYRNDGYRRMKMIWVVGSKSAFGPDGSVPCATTKTFHSAATLEQWVRLGCLLSYSSGLSHDFGKVITYFADQLECAVKSAERKAATLRHEWASMKFVEYNREGKFNNDEKWPSGFKTSKEIERISLCEGVHNISALQEFLVATHHKLFCKKKNGGVPDIEAHISSNSENLKIQKAFAIPESSWAAYKKSVERLGKLQREVAPDVKWRGLGIFCRAALIFADHQISSLEYEGKTLKGEPFANTKKNKTSKKSEYNQPLWWHLENVADLAERTFRNMTRLKLQGLPEDSIASILRPAPDGIFDWQNKAVSMLRQLRERSNAPALIFNIAATGAGKTIMNVKCAAVLGNPERVRCAIVLNQRSLTLQTSDSLREDLGLSKSELATIIGDRTTLTLHENSKTSMEDPVDMPEKPFSFEADISDQYWHIEDLPSWLHPKAERSPSFARITATPVLVSTIDYLIAAGDLRKQGHHVDALLRLIDSDLIIDETDSYDPQALPAVLRLIQMTALCGRNVVCSSATLPGPIAAAIEQSFRTGIQIREGMTGEKTGSHVAIIDNIALPEVFAEEGADFEDFYTDHINKMFGETSPIFRLPYIQKVEKGGNEEDWMESICTAVKNLHLQNSWGFAGTSKKVSFGLVRVANIHVAVRLARYLANELPEAKVACYHSADFRIQRHHKEHRLDYLLKRKNGNKNIEKDQEIQKTIECSQNLSTPFIVVATPVEEIGRDHDFDWAVIEPSSTQSIVQTAGRVNRHRRIQVATHNIAIMEINSKKARGVEGEACFIMPGLESKSKEHRYPSHNMNDLLDFSVLQKQGLDARLRFSDAHEMAKKDSQIIRESLKSDVQKIVNIDNEHVEWMLNSSYKDLRDKGTPKQTWRLRIDEVGHEIFERLESKVVGEYAETYVEQDISIKIKRIKNDWLCLDTEQLPQVCEDFGIKAEDGMMFEIIGNDNIEIVFDRSFGFSRKTKQ